MTLWRRREEVVGKDVIDVEAKKIGITKDVAWSEDGAFAIVIESEDEQELFLPYDEVERIGDVVFVKGKTSLQTVPTLTCAMCKHRNPSEAKFCAKCGRALDAKADKKESK